MQQMPTEQTDRHITKGAYTDEGQLYSSPNLRDRQDPSEKHLTFSGATIPSLRREEEEEERRP